jgi:L-seryl-tRNA(Ser) seleniumtransferase
MAGLLPWVDPLLRTPAAAALIARFGRAATVAAIRAELARLRAARAFGTAQDAVLDAAADALARRFPVGQVPVFNLTGTVLHTNLGRAPLPPEAAAAVAVALAAPTTLEFDLATGRRGEREGPVRALLAELTGAEAACVVNNNAGGTGVPRRTDRDRGIVPAAGNHAAGRRAAGGGGHHQPHPSA